MSFSCIDCNNEIGRERKKYLESNDAQTLLEYLKCKQLENPTYFYAMQIDKKDGWIDNFFGQMVGLSWITLVLVMSCYLTPGSRLISLKCI